MATSPALLVVDDEPLYCEACRRIFSPQGFRVDHSNDAGAGLDMAKENDYSAVLLDVKMPTMDGIEFLGHLRKNKPNIPVILMTGFPSIPNAADAVRLHASDYVTKPFTPEEITRAVYDLIGPQPREGESSQPSPVSWEPRSSELQFHEETWLQVGTDNTIRAGAALPKSEADSLTAVRLPRIGDAVYQGLPLLAVVAQGQPLHSIPSPVSGVVVAVNPEVADDPKTIAKHDYSKSWAVCIAPTRGEEECTRCQAREVIVLNRDPESSSRQVEYLRNLGCSAQPVTNGDELASMLPKNPDALVMIDEASIGDEGLEIVSRVKAENPSTKIVIVASRASNSEADYRARKIFYYAVEPFVDNEISEILHAAFCPEARETPHPQNSAKGANPLKAIHMTNQRGHRVCLMTPGGIIDRDTGLGISLRQAILKKLVPTEIYLGDAPLSPAEILKAASNANRVFVLLVKDEERIPGCLVYGTKGEYDWASGDTAEKVTALAIQPDDSGTIDELPPRVISALAARIVDDLILA